MATIKTDFKQTEVGLIPEGWDVKRLGDLVTFQRGYDLPLSMFESGKYPVIKSNGFAGFHSEFKARGPGVLLGRSGKLGDPMFVNEDYWPHNTTLFSKQFHNSDPKFMYYFLKRLNLASYNAGSAVPTLNRNHIHPILVGVPPLEEQRSIARILTPLDSKIELNQQMNKTLESIGKAIFKNWFVNFEFPNEDGKPYKSSGGEMVFNEELGKEIPKGWTTRTLNEISNNFDSKRIPLSSREREERKGAYPYYGAAGVLDYVNDFIFDGIFVLMGEDGSVIDNDGHAVLQYVWGKFWVNNHAHVLQGKGISSELLFLMLKNATVGHIVTGAVQPKINQENMNKLEFMLPLQDAISRFEGILHPLFEKVKTNSEQIGNLARIRDSLLPKIMSGKIRVPAEVR